MLNLPVCVSHSLFLVAEAVFSLQQLVVKQLVQALPDQVPGPNKQVSQGTQGIEYQAPHSLLLGRQGTGEVW